MNHKYLLKISTSITEVNNYLVPWKVRFNKEVEIFDRPLQENINDIIEQFQIGIAINDHTQNIKIITPFSVNLLFADCIIYPFNLKLKLCDYCYYSRLASYIFDDNINDDIINNLMENSLCFTKHNFRLTEPYISKIYINTIDDEHIATYNASVVFKNILNENIYPLIWIETHINNELCVENSDGESIIDKLLPGTPVYKVDDNTFMGMIYNNNDNNITIIPSVNINKMIINKKLNNIFFDFETNTDANISKKYKSSIMVKQTYGKTCLLKMGDYIYAINNHAFTTNGYLLFSKVGINVPLHTYIWYSNKKSHIINVLKDNNNYKKIKINTESLYNKLSISIEKETKMIIKDNIIFCKPNLLMFEWLMMFNINATNSIYFQYMTNPFYTIKQSYIFVGLLNFINHPIDVQKQLKTYINKIYKPLSFSNNNEDINMELFTVLTTNLTKLLINETNKTIDKLVICDSNENEITLNWLSFS